MSGTQSVAYHDGIAASWSDRYLVGGFRRRAAFIVNDVLPTITPGSRWLDAGCGSGVFSRILADRGADVTAIDGSAAMIAAAVAAKTDPPWLYPPRYIIQTIDQFDAGEARFDGVICLSVLEYLDNAEETFEMLAARLAHGGVLIISVPNRHAILRGMQIGARRLCGLFGMRVFKYLDTSNRSFSRAALAGLARQRGLIEVKVLGFDPLLPPAFWRFVPPSLLFLVCQKPKTED